ncbi:MAG: tyrosine recombinase XerC [Betaproteobacteria bacterium]|nr:tyrosine recombinase XerC [Betaproteobacteria bacterium]
MDEHATGEARLAGFVAYLAAERRLSALTCQAYARDVRMLLDLLGDLDLKALTPQQVRRFVATLHARGLGGRSLARVLSAWRGFYRYLGRDHRFEVNPCVGVRAPKSPTTLPETLSPDEAARLLAFAPDTALQTRDRAMFELFYSSGLRLSELVGLDCEGIDLREGVVRVLGKGNKARVVPVGSFAVAAVATWLDLRAHWAPPEERALFVTQRGRRLRARAIQYRIKALALAQGISANTHPHVLRHSFASHVLQSSGDLRAVQEMLGHASLSTTQVYTHLDFQHLAKVYDAAHPLAKKRS